MTEKLQDLYKAAFPTKALMILLGIGFLDLVVTAVLHQYGLIVELNPVMKPFIERSEWLFAAVKGLSLVLAWLAMARYAKTNLDFVRTACIVGSGAYVMIWTVWFVAGTILA